MIYRNEDLVDFETRICRIYDLIVTRSNIFSDPDGTLFAFNSSLKRVDHKQRFEIIFYWYTKDKVPKKYLKRQRIFVYYHEIWEQSLYTLISDRMLDKYELSRFDFGYMVLNDEEVYELIQ